MNFIFNFSRFYFNISILAYHCLMSNLLCSEKMVNFTDEDTFYISNRSEKEEIIDIENLTDNTFSKNANTTKIDFELKNDVITAENSYKIKTTNFIHFDKSEGKILNDLFDEQKQIIAKIGFLLIQYRKEDDFYDLDLHNNFEYLYFDLISSTEKICTRMFDVLKKIFGTYYKQKKDILKKIKFIRKIQNLIKKKMNGKKGNLRTKICLKEELKKLMIFRSKIYRLYKNQTEKQREMVEILLNFETSCYKTVFYMRNIFEKIKVANFNYVLKIIPEIFQLIEDDVNELFKGAYMTFNKSLNSLLQIDDVLLKFF